jgi:[acyl-carrier-protein] S-malonyltransferase
MLTPWLELPGVADWLGEFSDVAGLDLVRLGTTADADEIRDTAIAQPLLVATALLTARALHAGGRDNPAAAVVPGVVAGHSVGEFGALVLAGVLDGHTSLRLVALRGRAMAQAAAQTPTGMSAVLGGEPDEVLERLAALDLTPANVNGGGQVVAAGALDALAALAAEPPARAKVIALQVAGAFHTDVMAPAVDELAAAAAGVTPGDPHITLLSNADGAVVRTGAEALERVVRQVARPVRWDLCQETMGGLGVTGLLELAPGGVLTGLARRALPDVERVALKSPADLDAARDLVVRHSGSTTSATNKEEQP